MEHKPKILVAGAVWGEWHINALCMAALPTLLAPGNFPALACRCELSCHLYTRRSDIEKLTSAPAVKELSRVMSVEIKTIPEPELARPIGAHHWAWNHATREAKQSGRLIHFLQPDIAWAEDSFARIGDLVKEGKKAFFMYFPRVVSDTFVSSLRERRQEQAGFIAVSPREMVALALRHLHPLTMAFSHDSLYFPSHPEVIVWPVRGEGMLARVLSRELFLFDPCRVQMAESLLVKSGFRSEEAVCIDDSDMAFGVSLAPLGKDISWHMQYRRATPLSLARWWLENDSPSNDFIARTSIQWHMGKRTLKRWQRQEIRSDRLIRDAMAAREGLRVWRELDKGKCGQAASLLALVTGLGLLPKAFRSSSPTVIFVPSDDAFRCLPGKGIQEMATSQNADRLLAFLRHHVVVDPDGSVWAFADTGENPPGSIRLVTVAGESLTLEKLGERLTVNGLDILGVGRQIGRHLVFPIDGILDPTFDSSIQKV